MPEIVDQLPPPSFARATFVTHSVPDFHPDDSFVLACTVPGQSPHNFRESLKFHLAEFGAFKFLIERTATRTEPQFITSVEPANLPYLNYGDKNVLSGWEPYGSRRAQYVDYARIEGTKGDEERLCPGEIIFSLEEKIKHAADAIRDGGDPNIRLVIVICGPTTLQQDILINLKMPIPSSFEFAPTFLFFEAIREQIGKGVHSVLITPNMLGAGWVVNPNFTTVDMWESSLGSEQEERRAACNISPLIAKDVRTTFMKEIFVSMRADFATIKEPVENLGPEIGHLREAFQQAALRFFFEDTQPTGLNFDSVTDNWSLFVEGGRRVPIEQQKSLWDQLPEAVEGDRSRLNHNPSLTETTGSLGWLDRTLLPSHLKLLALVQRFDWGEEMSPEKKSHLYKIRTCQYLPEGMAAGIRGRLHAVSAYRLACHNMADLMVEMNPTAPSVRLHEGFRSLRGNAVYVDSHGNIVQEPIHPISLDQRMAFVKDLIYDPTHSEFLDDPMGLGDTFTHTRSDRMQKVEQSDVPCRYLAQLLHFSPTALSADSYDVRGFFTTPCREAACRDPPIQHALGELQVAIELEARDPFNRQTFPEPESVFVRELLSLFIPPKDTRVRVKYHQRQGQES